MDYRKKIKSKGLKITWLAEQLGISQPLLSMKLSGTRSFQKKEESKLKKLLK